MKSLKTTLVALLLVPLIATTVSCSLIAPLANLAIRVGAIKLAFSCLPEGTKIDTPEGPRPVESILPGDLVIGYGGTPVRVLQKHGYTEDPQPERFYRIAFTNGAVVDLCDMHRLAGSRARTLSPGREIAGLTIESVATYGGVERSYDLLTEDQGYQIDGVPVNSMIAEMAEALRVAAVPSP